MRDNNIELFLLIIGFLPDEANDDSLQYEFDVPIEKTQAVINSLNWKDLYAESDGEQLLSPEQVQEISRLTGQLIPVHLDIFIGVRSRYGQL